MKVGAVARYKTHIKDNKVKKIPIFYSYKDVHYDLEGWAEASKYLPEDYDLVYLKTENKKVIPGWSIGKSWDGLRLKPEHKISHWKRKPEGEDHD